MSPSQPVLAEQLKRSAAIDAWLYDECESITAPRQQRVILAASSYQLAMEHHRALVHLMREGMHGPALALLRPLVEAYTMGLWLHHCAQAVHFQQILDRKFTWTLVDFQRELDKTTLFGSTLVDDMRLAVKNMHGFTHGGIEHFQWRLPDEEVRPSYPEDLLAGALSFADAHA